MHKVTAYRAVRRLAAASFALAAMQTATLAAAQSGNPWAPKQQVQAPVAQPQIAPAPSANYAPADLESTLSNGGSLTASQQAPIIPPVAEPQALATPVPSSPFVGSTQNPNAANSYLGYVSPFALGTPITGYDSGLYQPGYGYVPGLTYGNPYGAYPGYGWGSAPYQGYGSYPTWGNNSSSWPFNNSFGGFGPFSGFGPFGFW